MTESISESILEKLCDTPTEPGVYLMKDAEGVIIYVGKAGNLKKRLSSYFRKQEIADRKTWALVRKINTFDTIITGTEKEALILESTLIKQHRPRYNIDLKDDKRYLSIRLDMNETYPALSLVRKVKKDGALYFGPYASAHSVRETLSLVNKTFRLRKCNKRHFMNRTRPCLNYQMNQCMGLCKKDVSPEVYKESLQEAVMFLKGRTTELIRKIKEDMIGAAEAEAFEKAAVLRDRLFAIERTVEKQLMVISDFTDRDVIGHVSTTREGLALSEGRTLITILFIRGGKLSGSRHFVIPETLSDDAETVSAFIREYYAQAHFLPKEILTSVVLEDADILSEYLSLQKNAKVRIIKPQRGDKAALVDLAIQNAENEIKQRLADTDASAALLARLQDRARLMRYPERIECFDNSNIQGDNPVAAMVVFTNGAADKSQYRKYKIRSVAGQDDYAYMDEVLRRRFGRGEKSLPYPDLLMVDGGKGQLNIAVAVLKDLSIEGEFDVVGIAKPDETRGETEDKIYLPGRANPIVFGKQRDLLMLLSRIRDEAHRSVITFHRSQHRKSSVKSILDNIPGVGPKRKQAMVKHFGSIKKIKEASMEELCEVPGMNEKMAGVIHTALHAKNATADSEGA